MLYEPQGIEFFLRMAVATALAVTGLILLWQSHTETSTRRRKSNATGWKSVLKVLPLKAPAPVAMRPLAPRLLPGAELSRLASVIDIARGHVQTVNANQGAAAVQIDAAEHALNRLLGEIADIMPSVIKPTMVPRRALEADPIEKAAPLAA